MEPIRIAILGAGAFASRRHLPDLKKDPRVTVVAACRRDPDALGRFADHFDIPGRFSDWREMLDTTPIDAVLIATPHDQHSVQALAALERGMHVLLEKPMAISFEDATQIRDCALANNAVLAVAFNAPYWAHAATMRDGIAEGKIGEIEAVTIRSTGSLGHVFGKIPMPAHMQGVVTPTLFRGDPVANGGGTVMDGGGHLISELLWVTGKKPLEVTAIMDTTPADMRASIVIRLESNILATISVVADSQFPEKRFRSTYDGGLGSLTAFGNPFQITWTVGGSDETLRESDLPPVRTPVGDWVDCIQSGAIPLGSPEHGLAVTRVLAAIYESASTGRSISLT